MVVAKTQSYASSSDSRPVLGDVTYYGALTDIIELNYYDEFKIVLFRCDWVDVTHGRGITQDVQGFTLISFAHLIHTGDHILDEPFVFASQAQQVIFVQDRRDEQWVVPLPIRPRDTFDLGDVASDGGNIEVNIPEEEGNILHLANQIETENDDFELVRSDIDDIFVDMLTEQQLQDDDDNVG